MAKNEFLPFGTAEGANVLSNQEYEALAARHNGFNSGVAKSKELNKVWRQASLIASAVAQFIVDTDQKDLLDTGDVADIKSRLASAINLIISNGDYVTNPYLKLELLKKIDKADITQQLGNDTGKVVSQNLLTAELGKKASVADVNSKLAKDQNGADIPNKDTFIKNLGLGEAAKSNLAQTTGTSKTAVMSQDAVTKFGDTKFDKTGGSIDGSVSVIRDGGAISITAKTENASVRYELKDSDGTVIGYVGTVSNTSDSPLALRSHRGNTTLSLSDGATFTNGKRNLTTDDQGTASLASNGWFKDKATGLITQWMLVDTATGTNGQTFNFPTQFPGACLSISTSLRSVANGYGAIAWQSVSNSGVTLVNVSSSTGASKAYIIAVGY
ncbi:gp53-like domain-containing protein [Morganella morganii]|uniref:gp53-like domain-containing protein n=1 Tax=Morganella morganii TaxID=582 RepID=UPI0031B065C1